METLAAGIIGFIIGAGLTILIAMGIRALVQTVERKAKLKNITEGKSQYFMQDIDGNKISIEDDDGEQ